jgi:GNAT superfamily N-acetyltransferase
LASAAAIAVVPANPSHDHVLASFFREAWNSDSSARKVSEARAAAAATNTTDRGQPFPTVVAVQGERVIGYCSTLPLTIWDGHQERTGYWIKGLMVLPPFRRGPLGFLLLQSLTRQLPLAAAVTVHPASRRLFGALGYRDGGAIPNFLHPLSLGRLLRRVDPELVRNPAKGRSLPVALRAVQAMGLATGLGRIGEFMLQARAVTRARPRNLEVHVGPAPEGNDLNELWSRTRMEMAPSPVRDSAALLSRYGAGGLDEPYRYVTVLQQNRVVAVAVVRRPRPESDPRLHGLRVATVSDIMFDPRHPVAGQAALRGARTAAKEMRADAILTTASHSGCIRVLQRSGYLRVPANIHFFLRDTAGVSELAAELGRWWLTRGDGHSDETF